jgi:dipeptide/tripeptide permease
MAKNETTMTKKSRLIYFVFTFAAAIIYKTIIFQDISMAATQNDEPFGTNIKTDNVRGG